MLTPLIKTRPWTWKWQTKSRQRPVKCARTPTEKTKSSCATSAMPSITFSVLNHPCKRYPTKRGIASSVVSSMLERQACKSSRNRAATLETRQQEWPQQRSQSRLLQQRPLARQCETTRRRSPYVHLPQTAPFLTRQRSSFDAWCLDCTGTGERPRKEQFTANPRVQLRRNHVHGSRASRAVSPHETLFT